MFAQANRSFAEELLLEGTCASGELLPLFHPSVFADADFVVKLIVQSFRFRPEDLMPHVSPALLNSKPFAMRVVSLKTKVYSTPCGYLLQYFDAAIRDDRDVVLTALSNQVRYRPQSSPEYVRLFFLFVRISENYTYSSDWTVFIFYFYFSCAGICFIFMIRILETLLNIFRPAFAPIAKLCCVRFQALMVRLCSGQILL